MLDCLTAEIELLNGLRLVVNLNYLHFWHGHFEIYLDYLFFALRLYVSLGLLVLLLLECLAKSILV